MANPLVAFNRWRLTKQTGYTGSPGSVPAGSLDLTIDNANGYAVSRDSSGVNTAIRPRKVCLFRGRPNDQGGWTVPVNTSLALEMLHLEILYAVKSNVAASNDIMYLIYNSDRGANYRYSYNIFSEAAVTPGSAGAALAHIAFIPAGGAIGADWCLGRIWLPWFRETGYIHYARNRSSYILSANTLNDQSTSHRWATTGAITSIGINVDGYPVDGVLATSEISVIGYRY